MRLNYLNKYWALGRATLESALIKKGDLVGNVLVQLVLVSSIALLWVAIYNPNQAIQGYSLTDTILYYVFVLMISYITTTNVVDSMTKSVKMGSFSENLLKPRNIFFSELARASGEQVYKAYVLIPIFIVIILTIYLLGFGNAFSWQGFVVGSIFAVLGFYLNSVMEFLIALLAFWLDETWSLRHFKELITDLIGGKRIPLNFFPPVIKTVNGTLPFQFIYFVPLEYILGKRTFMTNVFDDLILFIFWLGLFIVLISIIYPIGIKRYGAFGN